MTPARTAPVSPAGWPCPRRRTDGGRVLVRKYRTGDRLRGVTAVRGIRRRETRSVGAAGGRAWARRRQPLRGERWPSNENESLRLGIEASRTIRVVSAGGKPEGARRGARRFRRAASERDAGPNRRLSRSLSQTRPYRNRSSPTSCRAPGIVASHARGRWFEPSRAHCEEGPARCASITVSPAYGTR